MTTSATIVSAPGKVLVAGGYLVLDPAYQGLVLTTDSRFFTVVRSLKNAGDGTNIRVRSPQLLDGVWQYYAAVAPDSAANAPHHKLKLSSVEKSPRNSYVEAALEYALGATAVLAPKTHPLAGVSLDIIIVCSNDFYSQREQLSKNGLDLTTESLRSLKPFCSTMSQMSKVHKTGLGSSAAMITSLVGAVMCHFNVASIPLTESSRNRSILSAAETRSLELIHNTAQLAHCVAQGKIGSGFDVCAAVWGSHTYKRFSPKVMDAVMKTSESGESMPFSDRLLSVVQPPETHKWDYTVETGFLLPEGFQLLLADIDAGSSTPKLVSKVLAWRQSHKEQAHHLWTALAQKNNHIDVTLRQLYKLARETPTGYQAALRHHGQIRASEWSTVKAQSQGGVDKFSELFVSVYETFMGIRSSMREMSKLADVPIEPAEQTRLLDACMNVPGVIMAGVPGAGGYDAIFCIALSDAARKGVENVWQGWTEMSVGPLLSKECGQGLYRVSSEANVAGLEGVLKSNPLE